MTKVLVIPDLHEKTCWKERVSIVDYDKVVFLGDYVDSWTHDDEKCINNLRDIITFKKANKDNCILLLGNHDIQYLYAPKFGCDGFQPSCAATLKLTFEENQNLFQIAYQIEDALFTHAGVSSKWFKIWGNVLSRYGDRYKNLGECLNNMFKSAQYWILFEVGTKRSNYSGVGGPIWADREETLEGIPSGYYQIVGHTRVKSIEHHSKIMGTTYTDRSITYCDCLDKNEEYLLLTL